MESLTHVAQRIFGAHYDPPEHVWLAVLFSPSEAGQAAGMEFLKRKHIRQQGRDPEVNDKVSPAQIEAMDKWGFQQEGSYGYLKTIKQPTLVVNGSNDVIMPTINSFIMQQNIPNAQLVIYPDSNHGSQFQYPNCSSATSRCSFPQMMSELRKHRSIPTSNREENDHDQPLRKNRPRH